MTSIQQLDPQVLRFFSKCALSSTIVLSEAALQEAAVNLKVANNPRYRLETAVDALPEDAERLAKLKQLKRNSKRNG